jgi:hypothetical protein
LTSIDSRDHAVDVSESPCENESMEIALDISDPALIAADGAALMESIRSGKPLDPEVARRVDERAERITERLRRQHGTLDVAVDLVREVRDAE